LGGAKEKNSYNLPILKLLYIFY